MSTVLFERSSRAHLPGLLTHCTDCGRLSYDNDSPCTCGSSETLEQVSHVGEIYSYTVVHQGTGTFILALIKLTGGPIVTGRIVGVDRELKVGLPVEFLPDVESSPSAEFAGLFFCPLGTNAVAGR